MSSQNRNKNMSSSTIASRISFYDALSLFGPTDGYYEGEVGLSGNKSSLTIWQAVLWSQVYGQQVGLEGQT